MGESILGMILRLRLEAVKRKLAETDMAIGQITASCGFRSETRAKHLLRQILTAESQASATSW